MLGFLVLHCPSEFVQTHVHWVGDAIQPSHPLVAPFSSGLHSFPASDSFAVSQLLTLGGQSIRASASAIKPSSEYSGLISFQINWFDDWFDSLLAVQGTLKSCPAPQFESIISSALSFLYGPTPTSIDGY